MADIIHTQLSHRDKVRTAAKHLIGHESSVLTLVLIGLIIGFVTITKGKTFTINNITNVLIQSSVRGVVSVGEAFVVLSGNIDISVGGVALLSMIIGGALMTGTTVFPVVPIAVMLLAALGIGAFQGLLISRLGLPSLIVTLAMWQINYGTAQRLLETISPTAISITNLPTSLAFLAKGDVGGIPMPVIILITVSGVAYWVLNHTRFGRSVYAVGGNPTSAWLSGINVKRTTFTVFLISGFLAALGGVILMARIMTVGLATVTRLELDALTAVFIGGISMSGGKGNIVGVILGSIIIGVITNGMNMMMVPYTYQGIVIGIIMVTAAAIDIWRRR
ncbi:ABC transporter permease [Chloroflexota bacterium]